MVPFASSLELNIVTANIVHEQQWFSPSVLPCWFLYVFFACERAKKSLGNNLWTRINFCKGETGYFRERDFMLANSLWLNLFLFVFRGIFYNRKHTINSQCMEHNSEDKKGNLIFYLEMKKKINKITNSYWYFQNSCQKGYKNQRFFSERQTCFWPQFRYAKYIHFFVIRLSSSVYFTWTHTQTNVYIQ